MKYVNRIIQEHYDYLNMGVRVFKDDKLCVEVPTNKEVLRNLNIIFFIADTESDEVFTLSTNSDLDTLFKLVGYVMGIEFQSVQYQKEKILNVYAFSSMAVYLANNITFINRHTDKRSNLNFTVLNDCPIIGCCPISNDDKVLKDIYYRFMPDYGVHWLTSILELIAQNIIPMQLSEDKTILQVPIFDYTQNNKKFYNYFRIDNPYVLPALAKYKLVNNEERQRFHKLMHIRG